MKVEPRRRPIDDGLDDGPDGRQVVLVLGPPAGGKGTQSLLLGTRLGLPAVSVGALIREELADESAIGTVLARSPLTAEGYPEELVFGLLVRRLSEPDCVRGVVLDGFPRSVGEASVLLSTLVRPDDLCTALHLDLDEDEILRRARERTRCERCGTAGLEPAGPCRTCGAAGAARSDDVDPAFVRERVHAYTHSRDDVLAALRHRFAVHELPVAGPEETFAVAVAAVPSTAAGARTPAPPPRPVAGATGLQTVISGSYRRHLGPIYALRDELARNGIGVLSPVGDHAVNPGDEFVILDADPVEDPRLLQDSVFAKLRQSSFLVLANVDGHLGTAAAMEVGFALSLGLQVLTVEPVADPNLAPYTRWLPEAFPGVDLAGVTS